MAEQASGSQAGSSNGNPAPSPGGKPMGAIGITLVAVYFIVVAVVVFHSLVVLWPPLREPNEEAQVISDRLARIEKAVGLPTQGNETEGEGTQDEGTQGEGGTEAADGSTVEPSGTDLMTTDVLGSDLDPMGSDLGGGTGTSAEKDKKKEQEQQKKKWCEERSEDEKEQRHAELFWSMDVCLSDEERLFLIVMFAGALGGLAHAFRSFFWYAGNRKLVLSWAGFYITLPILGATMATVFYLVIRGGFFSPQSEISDTSPFGFAALAALIGMFTEQAAEKLKQITQTLFAEAPKGEDHADVAPVVPQVTAISPSQGSQGTPVTITGSGFAQNATVTFGGQAATDVKVASDGTSITVKAPAGTAGSEVDVEVANSGDKKATVAKGFKYA